MSYYDYQQTARYIQCEGALDEIRRYTFGLGKKFLILTSCGVITEDVTCRIRESFAASMADKLMPEIANKNSRYNKQMGEAKRFDQLGVPAPELAFMNIDGVDVTDQNIEKLVQYVKENGIDVVVGAGGGRAMDFSRGIAFYTNIRCVLVPTSASTNAAATQLSIVHADDGSQKEHYLSMANYPDLVLADTGILIGNSGDMIVAGAADQICSYYEYLYDLRHIGNRDQFSELCLKIVDSCQELLLKYTKAAREAAEKKEITKEFEMVLSMILHNSGIARSLSGSGLSHTLGRALVLFPACRTTVMHGMQVGYGIIPMMIAEGESAETVQEYIRFAKSVGIPTTLAELNLADVTRDELLAACNEVCDPNRASVPFSGEQLTECIYKAEELVRALSA
ncbi:MAG: iron-containing alcohol dehydrogenase [Mogibacterium sp.]|nr:iron-containing alcohol dehydrogenase [Mogibacterium sp.]